MPIVCGIKFRGIGKAYYFSPGDLQGLDVDSYVVVETSRGRELGQVVTPVQEIDDSSVVGKLKPIVRHATTLDLLDVQRFRGKEGEALMACREQVARFDLAMKIVSAEYSYDGSRLTFFFTSEERVDFRDLVRELARSFKTRIDLRQIGVRDEARVVGGLGKCGRCLCCSTWLTRFNPVSIRMAKQQGLPLSPMEISGICGRLLCCLAYENDFYQEIKRKFPKTGKRTDTPLGPGKALRVNVFKETISILLDNGVRVEMTADQLAGKSPIEAIDPDVAQRRAINEGLSKVMPSASPSSRPQRGRRDGGDGQSREQSKKKKSRSSRSRRRPRGGAKQRPAQGQASDQRDKGQKPGQQGGQSSPQTSREKRRTNDGRSTSAKRGRRRSRRSARPSVPGTGPQEGRRSQEQGTRWEERD
jgi:cell fate regulator YaaT (PSP1 superfamily)